MNRYSFDELFFKLHYFIAISGIFSRLPDFPCLRRGTLWNLSSWRADAAISI